MKYNRVFSELQNNGFLDYGRMNGVLSLLGKIVKTRVRKERKVLTAELSKYGKKCIIKFGKKNISFSGNPDNFEKEFNLLREDCWTEYAESVRDKQLMINGENVEEFFNLLITPILLESFNIHKTNPGKLAEIINSKHAHLTKWFFFMKDVKIRAENTKKSLTVKIKSSVFELKNIHENAERDVKTNNLGQYQFFLNDVFIPGLPYTIMVLNGKKTDFKISGKNEELVEIAKTLLESVYEYIMVNKI